MMLYRIDDRLVSSCVSELWAGWDTQVVADETENL